MSDDVSSQAPYRTLGDRLRRLRERSRESLAEVSGAVEIDINLLEDFEKGQNRPAEEILLLLISHFNVKDEEAGKLWRLAGYEQQDIGATDDGRPSVFVLPADARINYTDMINVTANEFGVTINFMQTSGPANQPMIISRVGMSREHAKSMIELLKHTISQTEKTGSSPKFLPEPKQKKDNQE